MPCLQRYPAHFSRLFFVTLAVLIWAVLGAAQDQPAKPTEPGQAQQSQPQQDQAQQDQNQQDQAAPPAAVPADQSTQAEAETDESKPVDPTMRLGVSDLLEVSVYNVPELTTKTRVGSNGDIYLPLIDYVHVADLSLEEAQTVIEKRLSDGGFVKNPHVSIFLSEYTSHGVSVMGEVTRPGVYPVMGNQRLFDVLSAAGGLSDKSGRTVAITHRGQPDKPIIVPLARNLMDHPESNVEMSPGDTVIVRKADIVYIVGEVSKPSGLAMDPSNLTVLKAIALVGGTTNNANLNAATIVRKGPDGTLEIPVPLKKMLQAKAPDQSLLPDDILFVPTATTRIVGGKLATIAAQAAIAAAMVAAIP